MDRLAALRDRLAPLRTELLDHPLYGALNRLDALRRMMEHHVFAVWDFMSLLKALQRRLCCVDVPWRPPVDGANCRLINEIVLAEESDVDNRGGFASHFELYRQAMRQCGADTRSIDRFLVALGRGESVTQSLASAEAPAPARAFVEQTFAIIHRGSLPEIAAAFAFGREDLLPAVFSRIVAELNVQEHGKLAEFQYYLARHIDLDGDEHGPMAARLVASLCVDDSDWRLAEETAASCLVARRELWDGIQAAIRS